MPKVFIVHRWEATPQGDWYPWLKKELEAKGFYVQVPEMPNTDEPKIEEWVPFLAGLVEPNKNLFFVGHSVGCQTILRYLEAIQSTVGGVVLVAPWVNLTQETLSDEETKEIALPWITTPIDWKSVESKSRFTAFFSDNDPYVPLSETKLFGKNLRAKTIVEHEKGHFTDEDGVTQLPMVLEELLKMVG